MWSALPRPTWARWLYTHNPFYAISVVLMLFGVRAAWGELEIGSIDCWIMIGVLAAYTLVLAAIAVAIVRWGRVWDDARTLFVSLLLLFLAVSISADELFVNSSSASAGVFLLLGGFLGSALLSETVLRGARIRLGWSFRGPYHLLLALFYIWPWWCSPELHRRSAEALEWTIFLFPTAAAGLFVLLLPAVRRGREAVADNGTPWPWPWFPWTMFGAIAAAVAIRSFVLSMTFGPTGPIWVGSSTTVANINFDTIFGTWFLVPLAFVLMWLVLEGALVSGNERLQQRMLMLAPFLVVLSLPMGGAVFESFLNRFVERLGSPMWISAWLLVLFYGRAWLARIPRAGWTCAATLLLFSVVGPETVNIKTATVPQSWPLFAVGAVALVQGAHRRSSAVLLIGSALLTLGLWLVLPEAMAADFRMTLCYHLLLAAVIAIGLVLRDRLAVLLRAAGAAQMLVTAFVALASPRAEAVPLSWRVAYVAVLAAAALAIAGLFRQRWYLYAFAGMLGFASYAGVVIGYREAVAIVGRPAMMAISWSGGSLLVALLISARKANWLKMRRVADPGGTVQPPGRLEGF
ncbi:MAG: hypothetical protein KY476_15825 [Planctomycetes bacterium]|nr:hypothetical protein [Planctomycetota bacterium]